MWGLCTDPTACAATSRRCALWHRNAPGWGASRRSEGRLGLGAHSLLAARPWGRQLRSAAHLLWGGRAGVGTRQWPYGARALQAVARCGGGRMLPRGEGPLAVVRASGVRRFPSPGRPSLMQVAGPRCPCSLAVGGAVVRGPATTPQRALLRAGVARRGGGRRTSPGGAPSCRCERRLGLGAHPPPAARPWGRQSGSAAHLLSARVCGCGDPALAHWRACPAGCRALRGRRELAPGVGGTSHRSEGRLVSGALPPSAARPWGR